MRHPIWKKDDFFELGPGVLRVDMDAEIVDITKEKLALCYNYNWNAPTIGEVTDLRLEEGEISGEVRFFKESDNFLDIEGTQMRLGGYYNKVLRSDDHTQVLSCKLEGVAMILKSNTAGYKAE